jgi:hypothetical protein
VSEGPVPAIVSAPVGHGREPLYDSASFRDRRSRVFYQDGQVLRALDARGTEDWRALSRTRLFGRLVREGALIATDELGGITPPRSLAGGPWCTVLRHDPVPVISYPFEWSFTMMKDAALRHLDIMLRALDEKLVLKDASPYNYQWVGVRPVLIDIGSFAPLIAGEPWIGYRQFCRMFLYPLLLEAYRGIPCQPWLRASIEGVDAETCWRVLSAANLLRPGVLRDVYLQYRFERACAATGADVRSDLQRAGFTADMLKVNLRRLQRVIDGLDSPRTSAWTDYAQTNQYEARDQQAKTEFVARICASRRWRLVWDIGSNTGAYSRIAGDAAGYVLALDADAVTVNHLYESLKQEERTRLLPLMFDVADPSPPLGWRNRERPTLEERGRPDLVLFLAVLHHLVIGAGIPLPDVIDWLASLEASVVIEFVDRDDPMVRRLLGQKNEPYADYDRAAFERCLSAAFDITDRRALESGTRRLYAAERRR